jgi:hypothetical protein
LENIYRNFYETGTDAREVIDLWIDFYNGQPGPPLLQGRNTEAA